MYPEQKVREGSSTRWAPPVSTYFHFARLKGGGGNPITEKQLREKIKITRVFLISSPYRAYKK